MKRIYGIAVTSALLSFGVHAQEPDQVAIQQLKVQVEKLAQAEGALTVAFAARGGLMSTVKDAPYSADQITENTQTLGDGTRIHHENKVTITRDAQGRVRQETPDRITIWDPVANVRYTLNPATLTGSKMKVMATRTVTRDGATENVYKFVDHEAGGVAIAGAMMGGGGGGVRTATAPPNAVYTTNTITVTGTETAPRATAGTFTAVKRMDFKAPKKETLGQQKMEGVNVDGVRETLTYEAGDLGNDRPINVVTETWYSSELQTEVLSRHTDPRTGEQVTRLSNVRLGEPNASLFQVPPSYQISEGPAAGGRGGVLAAPTLAPAIRKQDN